MTNKKLTEVQLQQFRNHAKIYPVGDTAKLLAHIDWMQGRLHEILEQWDNEFGFSELDLAMSVRNIAEGGE